MAKRRTKANRTRAKRHNQRIKLHQLASIIQPRDLEPQFLREAKVRSDLPVFICGTTATIDPDNPTNMGRIARAAIREAHTHLGVRAAHGVGENTTVIIQGANGWIVRNRHGDIDHATTYPRIDALDAQAQSKRANRQRVFDRQTSDVQTIIKNKSLRQEREDYARKIFEAEMELHIEKDLGL